MCSPPKPGFSVGIVASVEGDNAKIVKDPFMLRIDRKYGPIKCQCIVSFLLCQTQISEMILDMRAGLVGECDRLGERLNRWSRSHRLCPEHERA